MIIMVKRNKFFFIGNEFNVSLMDFTIDLTKEDVNVWKFQSLGDS